MGLAEYLGVLRKHWLTIAATAAVAVLLAMLLTVLVTPRYQASSQVFVSVRGGEDSVSALVAGRNFSAEQVTSYTELVTSPRVLTPVIEELGLADTAASLASRVSADRPKGTVLINIAVADESPSVAASAANGIAVSLATVVPELEMEEGSDTSPVEISTIREATAPVSPISPRPALNIALGLVAGLVLGVGIAVLRDLLDTRVRTPADIEAITGASTIGTIPFDDETPRQPLIVSESPHSLRAEAFRRLRTNLQFLEVGSSSRCFVVVSALPGEGKSTTTINLAIALADAGSRVAVVDGDLRRPSVSRYLGLEGSVGLTTVLIGKVGLADAMQPWGGANLHVLPSGQIPPNPSELLGSIQMVRTIERLTQEYDVVLIDSAPLLPVTDGAILARMTGGAILVVGAGVAHKAHVLEAAGALRTVDADLVGTVLNRDEVSERSGYQYRYYSSDTDAAPEGGNARRSGSSGGLREVVGRGLYATGMSRGAAFLGRSAPTIGRSALSFWSRWSALRDARSRRVALRDGARMAGAAGVRPDDAVARDLRVLDGVPPVEEIVTTTGNAGTTGTTVDHTARRPPAPVPRPGGRPDGGPAGGARPESARSGGAGPGGAQPGGPWVGSTQSRRARPDGGRSDGVGADGAPPDGTRPDGAERRAQNDQESDPEGEFADLPEDLVEHMMWPPMRSPY